MAFWVQMGSLHSIWCSGAILIKTGPKNSPNSPLYGHFTFADPLDKPLFEVVNTQQMSQLCQNLGPKYLELGFELAKNTETKNVPLN